MAEILLSLTIIGVVAAITLPSLTGNINERTWNTQRKALYARFSQAVALMPNLNGYGSFVTNDDGTVEENAAETFVTAGLSKVMKLNNICDNGHLADCGIPSKILYGSNNSSMNLADNLTLRSYNPLFTSSYGVPQDVKAAAFETANGESILVYYNPFCVADMQEPEWFSTQTKMCANFIYDLNGTKGPNTFGKDVGFISVLYPTDSVVVAPIPIERAFQDHTQENAGSKCRALNNESRMPNRDELSAMFYNNKLVELSYQTWSSTVMSYGAGGKGWIIWPSSGYCYASLRDIPYDVRCIKR